MMFPLVLTINIIILHGNQDLPSTSPLRSIRTFSGHFQGMGHGVHVSTAVIKMEVRVDLSWSDGLVLQLASTRYTGYENTHCTIYETYKSVSYIHTKSAKNDRTYLCLIHSVCPGKFRLQSVVTGVFRGFWSSSWNCRKEMEVMICSQPWTEGSSIAMALNLGKLLYVRSNCSAWNERWPSIYWDASPFSSYINVYIYISLYITLYHHIPTMIHGATGRGLWVPCHIPQSSRPARWPSRTNLWCKVSALLVAWGNPKFPPATPINGHHYLRSFESHVIFYTNKSVMRIDSILYKNIHINTGNGL